MVMMGCVWQAVGHLGELWPEEEDLCSARRTGGTPATGACAGLGESGRQHGGADVPKKVYALQRTVLSSSFSVQVN